MLEGIFTQKLVPIEEYMPYAPYPMYPSGLKDSDNAVFRYSRPSSDYPVLILPDAIFDSENNMIPPGYYSLILSDERNFLVITQGDKIVATMPVFKVEEDKLEFEKLRDKKYQKQKAKEEKRQAKIDAKQAKSGIPPTEKEVYMKADVEFHKDGDYYLIKYERDKVRAWGAIKR